MLLDLLCFLAGLSIGLVLGYRISKHWYEAYLREQVWMAWEMQSLAERSGLWRKG